MKGRPEIGASSVSFPSLSVAAVPSVDLGPSAVSISKEAKSVSSFGSGSGSSPSTVKLACRDPPDE